MPRSAPNSDCDGELATRTTTVLPASTLARSSRSSTSSVRFSAALRMKRTCVSCSAVSSPSLRVQQQPRQRQDRVQRRAELVAHVREELRLQLVGATQVVGALVQFGVQGDHAAVGVLQLLVEPAAGPPGAPAAHPSCSRICWFCWRISAMASGRAVRRQRIRDARRASPAVIGVRPCAAACLPSRTVVPCAGLRCRCRTYPSGAGRRAGQCPCRSRICASRRGPPGRSAMPGPRSRTTMTKRLRGGCPGRGGTRPGRRRHIR